jgi:Zn-dependent protease with chaperone function
MRASTVRPGREKTAFAWGTSYAGSGDLEIARRAVERALIGAGMQCRTTRVSDQCLLIQGVQTAHWYDILLRARPQRARWQVERCGEALRLSSDFDLFRWYAAILALLWTVIASCFVLDYLIAKKGWLTGPSGTLVAAGIVGLAVALMPVIISLLGALGGRSSERLWHDILHEVELAGDRLEPQNNANLRYSFSLIGSFGFVLALTVWFATYSLRVTSLPLPRGSASFLAVLAGLIVLLIVTIALMLGRRGFNLRTYPILTGLMSMLSVLFLFQSILLPWWMASRVDFDALGAALRSFGWLLLGGSLFLMAAVVYLFFYYTLYSTLMIRPQLMRLHSHREAGVYRLAAGGASPLPFQIVFLLSWLLLTGLILASLAYLVACTIQGVAPFFDRCELQLVDLSSQAMAAAFGLPPAKLFLTIFMRGLWLLFALGGMSLLLASTGQLLTRRRTLRRHLAAAANRPFPRRKELAAVLEELRHRAGLPSIRLALTNNSDLQADSERFGGLRGELYIEISTGCLELPVEQIRAVLAHECAHHYLGHLALRSFLLWLGRLSFTGDGFVFALQDTYDYERQADRAAVRILGVMPEHLAGLLRSKRQGGLVLRPVTSRDPSLAEKWRYAFSLFRSQYYGTHLGLYYWHPGWRERIEALRDLE